MFNRTVMENKFTTLLVNRFLHLFLHFIDKKYCKLIVILGKSCIYSTVRPRPS